MAGKTGSTLVEGRAKELRERMRILPFTGAGRNRPGRLTDRQLEILDLVSAGRTNKEIGSILSIGTTTVNSHLRNILQKTGAANRAEASAVAIRNSLVKRPGRSQF
jgi:DNA-binding CsgD family transcriptional regulator